MTSRYESSVTSVSWIPREAVEGLAGLPFSFGATHYDLPPPDVIGEIEELTTTGAIRFANQLRAWIEVSDGRIVKWGQSGGGHLSETQLNLGGRGMTFANTPYPDLRPEPEMDEDGVRFLQTSGGRTGLPAPRYVRARRFFQLTAPVAWTTLSLTLQADGRSQGQLVGASTFPRHWVYDDHGRLFQKSGLIDFDHWYRDVWGDDTTPWGKRDSTPLVTPVESELERQLSRVIIDSKPRFVRLRRDQTLVEQGDEGDELFLLFDGVIAVEQNGETVVEFGPGAILGEMALLEGGRRTATLRAVTPCRVAVVSGEQIDRAALSRVAEARRPPESP